MNNKEAMANYARIFLMAVFTAWAFRLAIVFNAQIDAIFMLLFTLLIYASRNR